MVFAGDLIEHLPNPGLFIDASHDNLVAGGRLVLSTPNTFSFAKLTRVLVRRTNEPPVNPEHTCSFSPATLTHLASRHGFSLLAVRYGELDYSPGHGSRGKRLQLALNARLSRTVPRFSQTMVPEFARV